MKMLLSNLVLVILISMTSADKPVPRKLLIMRTNTAEDMKYNQQQKMLAEQTIQVKNALERFGLNAGMQELNADAMEAIHDRYIRARMQMDYVKNFLTNKMDDVYNNFVGVNRRFY